MQKSFNIYFFIRSIPIVFIAIIPSLYISEILPIFILPIFSIVLILTSSLMYKFNIKFIPNIIIIILGFLIFWLSILCFLWIIQLTFIDIVYVRLKVIFPFAFILSLFVVITTSASFYFDAYRKYEALLFLFIFVLLFSSQSNYSLTVFEHSLTALVFVCLFCLSIIVEFLLSLDVTLSNFKLFLVFIPIMFLILFVFLIIYNSLSISNTGGVLKKSIFRFDFSDYLTLQDEIKLSDKLVMIVHTKEEDSYNMLRRMYLSGWSQKRGFFQKLGPSEKKQILKLPNKIKDLDYIQFKNRKKAEQEYFFVNLDPSSFIAMDYPVKVYPYQIWDSLKFNSAYKVDSMALNIFNYDFNVEYPNPKIDNWMSDELLDFYTDIDDETKEWILPLANSIVENVDGYYDSIRALLEFFTDGDYRYSLKPGKAKDNNQLKFFLLDSKKGYCSYFAFAYCLMLRSIGIPARVAVGFFLAENSDIMNYYPVRANMAHAWVEVFFPNIGWVSFDPTTTKLSEGENLNFGMDPGGEEFKNLLNEILESRNLLEYKDDLDSLENIDKDLFTVLKIFFEQKYNLIFFSLIIFVFCLYIFIISFPYLIIMCSKNNRRVILTIYKICKRKKILNSEIITMMKKAKFSPICSVEDVEYTKKLYSKYHLHNVFYEVNHEK